MGRHSFMSYYGFIKYKTNKWCVYKYTFQANDCIFKRYFKVLIILYPIV